jgi:hypothetical protein
LFRGINENLGGEKETGGGKRNFLIILTIFGLRISSIMKIALPMLLTVPQKFKNTLNFDLSMGEIVQSEMSFSFGR